MRLAAVTALLALSAAPGAAEEGAAKKDCACDHGARAASAPDVPSGRAAAEIRFPDASLVDQGGRAARLLSDVVRDRIVVMDFVFTTCTTVCPLLSGIMTGVQQGLGDAEDVALVSVTVDPARDTPARLEAYARRWRAGSRWTFLTGEREAVKGVLQAAGAYTADFTAHPPMVLVGDGRSGKWVRLNGFPKRAQVLAEVAVLRERRAATAAGGPAP